MTTTDTTLTSASTDSALSDTTATPILDQPLFHEVLTPRAKRVKAPKAPKKGAKVAKAVKAAKAPKKGAKIAKGWKVSKGMKKGGKAPKKGAKVAKAPKVQKPTTGQSAPKMQIPFADLNPKEQALLLFIDGAGEGPRALVPLEAMISVFLEEAGATKRAYSWVRNSLRDLVVGGWVDKAVADGKPLRGVYQISKLGRERTARVVASSETETPVAVVA